MKDFFRRMFSEKATVDYVNYTDELTKKALGKDVAEITSQLVRANCQVSGLLDEKICALYRHLGLDWKYDGDRCSVIKPSPAKVKKVKAAKSLGAKKK